jgi:exodeoxyribonuclease V alpha subunit
MKLQTHELDKTQLHAIKQCCDMSLRIVPVTGKAGTGKTTILRNVYEALTAQGASVVACAPTGKAAKRIKELTGINAVTGHRLLEYTLPSDKDPVTGESMFAGMPKRDKRNPIEAQVILADEYNMVNQEVHRNLLDALAPGACIRLFGDEDQLPPIEGSDALNKRPSAFSHLLKKFNGIRLETIHRQKEGNIIISNGARILQGIVPKRNDTYTINFTSAPVSGVLNWVMDSGYDFRSTDVQMISPTNVGWIGTMALNAHIQGLFHDPEEEYNEIERHTWSKQERLMLFVGDKVIQTVNQYSMNVFNGETGKVIELSPLGVVIVDFGDKILEYHTEIGVEGKYGIKYINPQRDLDLAYCITTHKTQGSEYEHITYVMNRSRSRLLSRRNLYTGQSRAKESVNIITDQMALSMSLNNRGNK